METSAQKDKPRSDTQGCTAPTPWLGLGVAVAVALLTWLAWHGLSAA